MTEKNTPEKTRFESFDTQRETQQVNRGYSWFVKFMRIGLPFGALILIAFVMLNPKVEEDLIIIPKEDVIDTAENTIGENELLNPRFETTDSHNQPVLVTATRAIYSQDNPDLVILEKPDADLQTSKGDKITMQAALGSYEQKTQKLFLQDNIKITHQSGYILTAQELRIDMEGRNAFSDKAVEITGASGKVTAAGLEAKMDEGVLIFKGPAKLILNPDNETRTPQEKEAE